jgi:hypothetical protein
MEHDFKMIPVPKGVRWGTHKVFDIQVNGKETEFGIVVVNKDYIKEVNKNPAWREDIPFEIGCELKAGQILLWNCESFRGAYRSYDEALEALDKLLIEQEKEEDA